MSRSTEAQAESRKKAFVTTAAAAVTVTAGVLVAWPLAIVGAVPTALLARDWWKHRMKNGLRL